MPKRGVFSKRKCSVLKSLGVLKRKTEGQNMLGDEAQVKRGRTMYSEPAASGKTIMSVLLQPDTLCVPDLRSVVSASFHGLECGSPKPNQTISLLSGLMQTANIYLNPLLTFNCWGVFIFLPDR